MKFDDLDQKMRMFETAHDLCVLPGLHMVARLDGRSFTRLTKDVCQFEAPFDPRFRDLMVDTTEHLMSACGFSMVYGYTESDEISLLFSLQENGFGRKLRKLISILAGEASAKFSLLLGAIASFDCRISQLPNAGLVVDYFRWRKEDPHRNALNAHVTGYSANRAWVLKNPRQLSRDCPWPTRTNCCSKKASTSTIFQSGKSEALGSTGKSTTGRRQTQLQASKP